MQSNAMNRASQSRNTMSTERLTLYAATEDLLNAELSNRTRLSRLLGAEIPADWPPELLDEQAVSNTLEKIVEHDDHAGWWLWFVLLEGDGSRTLIGVAGYKGPPDESGTVELG